MFVQALPDIELVVALVVLVYSPLLCWRHPQHCADVFALHVLASSPQSRWLLPHCNAACNTSSLQSWCLCRRCASVLASIVLAPLPALRWRCCPCRAGIPASIALASLPSTRWRHCLCCTGIIALVTLASAHWQCCLQHIVIAELASLPALRWRPCKHRAGVVTVVALALLPLLLWRLCPCSGATGVFALVLVSLPTSGWHLPNQDAATRHHHRAGVLAGAALASLQAPRWHHCWHLLASLSASRWRLCPCCAGIIALGVPASVQLQRCSQHVVVHCIVVKSVPLWQQQQAWHCWPRHPGCCLRPCHCPCHRPPR